MAASNSVSDRELRKRACPVSKRVKMTPADSEPAEEDERPVPSTRRKGKGKERVTKSILRKRDALKKDDNPAGESSSSSTDDMTTDATPREETAHSSRNRVSFQITDQPRFTSSLINMPLVRTHSETRPRPISSTNLSTFFPSSYLGSASSGSSSNSSNSPRSSFYISDILNHSSVGTRPSTVLHSSRTSETASAEDVASASAPSSNAINFHVTVNPARTGVPPRTDAPPRMDAPPYSGNPRVQVITSPRNSEASAASSRPNVMFSDSPIVIPDSPGHEEPQLPYPFSLRRFEMRRQLRARRRIGRRGAVAQQPRDNPSEPSTDDRDVPRPESSSQAAATAGSSSSVTFSFFHDRRPHRRHNNLRIMMRSPDDRSRDASVSEVIVVSSDEEDAEGTESNQRLSDEDLAHRIQMRELAGSHQEVPVLPEAQSRHGGPATTHDAGHSSSWPFPHPPPHFTTYSSHGSNPLSAFIRHAAFPGHPQRRSHISIEVGGGRILPIFVSSTFLGANLDYETLLDLEDRLGPAFPRGLSKKTLDSLPVRKFSDSSSSSSENNCVVCMSDFANEETIKTLPCNHEFHSQCIDPWLSSHKTCPICRTSLKDVQS